MTFLSVKNIDHTYFSKSTATNALENINIEADNGEFISILGPSGCGKTTLLSIIAGLIRPTKGEILLDGKQIETNKEQIGYMLQQDYLFPWKTIEENVLIGLKLLNKLTDDSKNYAFSLLQKMGLPDVKKFYPRQLSGGMRQRAALVRTLATEPKILLLDEPFSALDYQTKLNLELLVQRTLKSFRKTTLLVTHDIGEAIAMSDKIYLLSNQPGTVYKQFSVPEELRELTPFLVRSNQLYSDLFNEIWEELEQLEKQNKYTTPS